MIRFDVAPSFVQSAAALKCRALLLLPIGFLALALCASGQILNVGDNTSTPIPGAGHDYIKMLSETVNPANGSISIRIQTPTPEGRGISLPFSFAYDSNGAQHLASTGVGLTEWWDNSAYLSQGGWSYSMPMLSNVRVAVPLQPPPKECFYWMDYEFQDATGGRHSLGVSYVNGNLQMNPCAGASPIPGQVLTGGDDYYSASLSATGSPATIADSAGTVYTFLSSSAQKNSGPNSTSSALPTSIEDRNGNQIMVTDNGSGSFTVADTLGRALLTSSGFGASGNTVAVSGLQSSYSITWETISPNFTLASWLMYNYENDCNSSLAPDEGTTINVIKSIELPNLQSYQFSYDPSYGLLNQITYPTGGYVKYTWGVNSRSQSATFEDTKGLGNACWYQYDSPAVTERTVSFDGINTALTQTFSYPPTVWNNSTLYQWNSKTTTVTTTDNISGAVSITKYAYTPINAPSQPNDSRRFAAQIPLEQTTTYENAAGAAIHTVTKAWWDQYELKSQQTLLNDSSSNLTNQTTYLYGPGAQVTDKKEYDYGSSGPGILLRETATKYQAFAAVPTGATILDQPCQTVVYDGSSNRYAETDYYYDNGSTSTVCGTAGTPSVTGVSSLTGHDETNYSAGSTYPRGNITTMVKQCFQGATACTSGNPTTTDTYDETGRRLSMTDPKLNVTKYAFTDSYVSTNTGSYTTTAGSPPSGKVTDAYLTTITYPATGTSSHIESFTYGYNDGELTTSTDENPKVTTYYRYNDNLDRPTETDFPDGGQINLYYDDAAPSPSVKTTKLISSGVNLTTTSVMDGLGHLVQTQLMTDPGGTTYTATSYDGLGRTYQVWNPTRCSPPTSNCGNETTWGVSKYAYDAIGRTVNVADPDGSTVASSYVGNCKTVADETGALRRSCSDGLGRLIEVDEPGTGGQLKTAGIGSVTIGGSEQSITVPATQSTGVYGILGGPPPSGFPPGAVALSLNGTVIASAPYTSTSTTATVAATLDGEISSNLVSPSVSGSAITITSKGTGSGTNYSMSCVPTSPTPPRETMYVSCPNSMTGGNNAGTIYDSGSVTVSVNEVELQVSYGQTDTATTVATALVGAINGNTSTGVTASSNGNVISLTATEPGSNSNYFLSTSVVWNTSDFSSASFTATPSGSTLTGGTDGSLGNSPPVTLYTYDPLNNLTCAVQKGTDTTAFTNCASASTTWRPRSFVYDSLSRLTTAANPESGTGSYTYDLNGNLVTRVVPKAGQTGALQTTHNYTYDALNRLVQESHLDPSAGTEKYAYDGVALTGCSGPIPPSISSPTNLIGRRTAMCAGLSSSTWSYDAMGRPLFEARTNKGTSAKTYTVGYTYYKDGSLNTLTYPSGDVVTYLVGGAGRATQAGDTSNNYVTSASYAPHGALAGMTNGTGIVTSNTYNDRLQPTLLSAAVTGQNPVFSLCYDFHLGVSLSGPCTFGAYPTGDNGNVFQVLNNVDSTRSVAYSYDHLNRIAQANTLNSTSSNCWGEVYTIDNWSNLTNRAGVSGMGTCNTEGLSATATPQNQLSGIGVLYDAAGNITQDNLGNTPTYDAENRIATDAGYTYSYDADGMRMEKSTGSSGTMYWPGPGGAVLTETDLTGTVVNEEYVYFNGARSARVDRPSGAVHYYFSNHLGSASVITDAIGNIVDQTDYYPYGGVAYSSGGDPNHYKFTGKERDTESGLDEFGARYYASPLGRFMTPDWAEKPIDVPYADFGNPQSLNLYSYVKNNPTTTRDPDGHCAEVISCTIEFGAGGSVFGPVGTVVGGLAGAAIGGAIGYYGGKAILSYFHSSDNSNTAPAATPQNNQAPASNTAPASAPSLPDDANVVRGGSATGANSVEGIAAGTDTHPSGVTGFSVESAPGKSVGQLAAESPTTSKYGQVGCCTVGQVRAAGGDVVPTSGQSPNHATVTGVTPQQANQLLTPTIPNPAKVKPND